MHIYVFLCASARAYACNSDLGCSYMCFLYIVDNNLKLIAEQWHLLYDYYLI